MNMNGREYGKITIRCLKLPSEDIRAHWRAFAVGWFVWNVEFLKMPGRKKVFL
jgi:hypothetical protein